MRPTKNENNEVNYIEQESIQDSVDESEESFQTEDNSDYNADSHKNEDQRIGLYCTFTDIKSYRKVVNDIFNTYNIRGNKIFALIPRKFTKKREVYLTYHVVVNDSDKSKIPNTILTHRKKMTNTLFTINAMNKIIEQKTGTLDKNYSLNWEEYKNTLIISNDKGIRIIPIKVMRVFTRK